MQIARHHVSASRLPPDPLVARRTQFMHFAWPSVEWAFLSIVCHHDFSLVPSNPAKVLSFACSGQTVCHHDFSLASSNKSGESFVFRMLGANCLPL